MSSSLKYVGRLAAFLVAGVLALTVLSTAPGSAAPAKSTSTLTASTSADAATPAGTLARRAAPACWRRHKKCFGSIVVNPVRETVYFANDKMTAGAARNKAMRKCTAISAYHKYCKSAGWVRNYCMAVAARIPTGASTISQWASAGAANYTKAYKKAKAKLGGPAKNHYRWAYLCTTRHK